MAPLKVFALLFAFAGSVCALVAARYCLQANWGYPPNLAQSVSDLPELHILNVQVSLGKAGKLNTKAAKWTATAAVLGSIGSVVGLF